MSVSVVIPSKNRPDEIARMLASLRAQATMPLEAIVVDQSTPAYTLDPFPQLMHVHDARLSGLTAARNRGVSAARGDVVLFFDDDVVLESDCVAEIERVFATRPDIVGAQCAISSNDSSSLSLNVVATHIFERGFFNARPMRRGSERVPRLIDGLASAYRRTLFEHELFDERLTGYGLGEDWDFTKRAARHGKLVIAERARVRHEHSATNRHDLARTLAMRWSNTLYLYTKLGADRDIRNRFWKRWWMIGEELRARRYGLSTSAFRSAESPR